MLLGVGHVTGSLIAVAIPSLAAVVGLDFNRI